MGLLTEPDFDRLVAAGCALCGATKLMFRTYVDGAIPMVGGEPVGRITWVYDGEKFIDGVYEVRCGQCDALTFSTEVCPRCHAAGGLARALTTPNDWPVPSSWPSCEEEEVRYVAFVPARVAYDGKRAEKARDLCELHEDGFHGARVDCRLYGHVEVPERPSGAQHANEVSQLPRHNDGASAFSVAFTEVVGEMRRGEGRDLQMAEIFLKTRQVGSFGASPRLQRVQFVNEPLNEVAERDAASLHNAGGAQFVDFALNLFGPGFRRGFGRERRAASVPALADQCAHPAVACREACHVSILYHSLSDSE